MSGQFRSDPLPGKGAVGTLEERLGAPGVEDLRLVGIDHQGDDLGAQAKALPARNPRVSAVVALVDAFKDHAPVEPLRIVGMQSQRRYRQVGQPGGQPGLAAIGAAVDAMPIGASVQPTVSGGNGQG